LGEFVEGEFDGFGQLIEGLGLLGEALEDGHVQVDGFYLGLDQGFPGEVLFF